jgi:DNA polymerase delta subunit 1
MPLPSLILPCSTPGRWEETYLSLLDDQTAAEARQTAAHAACRDCHSGGVLGPVLCENGECPVTYARLACSSRVQLADKQLRRLDIF